MMEIPLTQGRVALVDNEDYPALSQYKWQFHDGYATRSVGNKPHQTTIRMHNVIMNQPGSIHYSVDHINRNGIDNRKSNLRVVKKAYQNFNKGTIKRILPRGVYKDRALYRACIGYKGKQEYIGSFRSIEEASLAYRERAYELYGEYPPE